MTTAISTTTQVFRVYIKAPAEKIWAAIVSPEWTVKYGYAAPVEYDLRPGGSYRCLVTASMREFAKANGFELPDVIIDGEVLECDPPHRLVQTWRMLMDPHAAQEPMTTITYEIKEQANGVCRLTLVHDLVGAPHTAAMISGSSDADADNGGGGWPWVLSDLKTLLETGQNFSS